VIQPELQQPRRPETHAGALLQVRESSYEDRILQSGEHYLGKLRYDDAAKTYKSFRSALSVPPRRAAVQHARRGYFHPGRVPKLVLESKREFASKYGLKA